MKLLLYIIVFAVGYVSAFSTLWFKKPAELSVYSCRPPADQGERLIVTLVERDGVLVEHCSYNPVTTKQGSRNLKDWRAAL